MRIYSVTLFLGVALFDSNQSTVIWNLLYFADMSFAAFVQSLIAASERYSRLEPVGNYLITMIDRYQDCVKACEHQHSKRAEERTADSYIRKQICTYYWYGIVSFIFYFEWLTSDRFKILFPQTSRNFVKNMSYLWILFKPN